MELKFIRNIRKFRAQFSDCAFFPPVFRSWSLESVRWNCQWFVSKSFARKPWGRNANTKGNDRLTHFDHRQRGKREIPKRSLVKLDDYIVWNKKWVKWVKMKRTDRSFCTFHSHYYAEQECIALSNDQQIRSGAATVPTGGVRRVWSTSTSS